MEALRNKINALVSKKYFYDIMLGLDLVFAILGWLYFPYPAMFISAVIAVFLLFVTKTFKYSIPFTGQIIFLFSGEFFNHLDMGFFLGGCGILFVGLLVYIILNRIRFKEARMKWSYLLLAILCMIPLIYADIPEGYGIYRFYFLQWILYFIFYIFAVNLLRGDMTLETSKSYGMIGCLLAGECIYKHFIQHLDWYFVGWGHANQANYLMIMFMPLALYAFIKEEKKYIKPLFILEIVMMLIGCYATGSRGFYIFFLLEAGLIYLYFVIKNKKWKLLIISCAAFIILAGSLFIIPVTRNKIMTLMSGDPEAGFFSGRLDIWSEAIDKFKESPLSIIFGHGAFTWLSNKYNGTNGTGTMTLQLCHSTFFHTLVMMGVCGIGAMIYHFYLKYKLFRKDHSLFAWLLLISLIVNDLYGLIDNTYHNYYFMMTLIIIYGAFEGKVLYNDNVNKTIDSECKYNKEEGK